MAKVHKNNRNETKSDIFHGKYSNLTSFLIGHKIEENWTYLAEKN